MVPFSAQAAAMPPTKLGVRAGKSVSVETIIYALVTKSANDAAAAIGEYLGGSEAGFARIMTSKARRLGMDSTVFRNASGLPDTGQFTTQEVSAANSALRAKSGAALLAGFQSAAKSSDPTAFSQNIMSIFASMSAEERQAAGWSDQFYQAAVQSYQSTTKLMDMFAQAGGSNTGFLSWLGK